MDPTSADHRMLFAGMGSLVAISLTARLFHDPAYPSVFVGEDATVETGR